jgi:methyl-accepting chemotaxis protein
MMKSIKRQLISVAVLLVIIPVAITNFICSYYFSNNIESTIVDNNKRLSSTIADEVKGFIDKAYTLTEAMAENKTTIDFNPEDQKEMLTKSVSKNPYFDLLYILKNDGNQTARSSGELANRANRWWFTQVMNEKKSFVSKSYYSVTGNSAVTSIFHPIFDKNSNMTGMFGADLKLNELQKLVDKYSDGKNRYSFILDSDGVVIAHPDKNQVSELYNYKTFKKTVLVKDSSGNVVKDANGNQQTQLQDIKLPQALKDITEKALKGESGTIEYTDNDKKEISSSYTTIKLAGQSQNWAVITVQDKASAMAVIRTTQIKNTVIALFLLLLVIILIYFLAKKFTQPISDLGILMQKASEGDLTVQSQYKSQNELGSLSNNFNLMMSKIKELITNIDEASVLVTNSSKTLAITTESTSKSIEQIATNISDVTVAADGQASNAETGLNTTKELSDKITTMTDYMNDGKTSADNICKVSTKGIEAIHTLESAAKESNQSINNVALVINSLSDKANVVGNIADTITSISEQTNLLALNAAIEAARAGEAGKGFSVVAEEVRKLSEDTASSSNNVKEIIFNVQKDIITAKDTINQAEVVIYKQNDAVKHARETFSEISSSIQDVVNKINITASSLNGVIVTRDQLITVMNAASKVAETLAKSSEQVSSITEEQSAAVEEISSLADELNSMSAKLHDSIRTFKIN